MIKTIYYTIIPTFIFYFIFIFIFELNIFIFELNIFIFYFGINDINYILYHFNNSTIFSWTNSSGFLYYLLLIYQNHL